MLSSGSASKFPQTSVLPPIQKTYCRSRSQGVTVDTGNPVLPTRALCTYLAETSLITTITMRRNKGNPHPRTQRPPDQFILRGRENGYTLVTWYLHVCKEVHCVMLASLTCRFLVVSISRCAMLNLGIPSALIMIDHCDYPVNHASR